MRPRVNNSLNWHLMLFTKLVKHCLPSTLKCEYHQIYFHEYVPWILLINIFHQYTEFSWTAPMNGSHGWFSWIVLINGSHEFSRLNVFSFTVLKVFFLGEKKDWWLTFDSITDKSNTMIEIVFFLATNTFGGMSDSWLVALNEVKRF